MSDRTDDDARPHDIDDTPTVTCSRCDQEWTLDYELDDLEVGNQSFEQFALDHMRHTGHFPDGVSPWLVACRRCPEGERFLSEGPARRWAETHARHARHAVEIEHEGDASVVTPE
ncbi:hypothetical protein C474_09527 [Halogeometricum pallidum JCM 14848]|uniref:Uncharacterized protein n=1 Tax=Halogeometricum pallidum JCM 14848 TaxID=1227487 RepID=M0D8P6_HALPD|nr:hypothetical protein [Halogeometricum pallidum]ELZ31208.1 hypothetical protein C474_09527 [Halogeometricum pallidum JCM 14848]